MEKKTIFITKTRLKKPNFYKSVSMLLNVNPSALITLPRSHERFTDRNWSTLSPGNAYLALYFLQGRGQYDWSAFPAAANKIFDILFGWDNEEEKTFAPIHNNGTRRQDIIVDVLRSSILTEEKLTKFIETSPGLQKNYAFLQYILNNKNLTPEQFEKVFLLLPSDWMSLTTYCSPKIIPSPTLEKILDVAIAWKGDDSYRCGNPYIEIFIEAIKRGILVKAVANKEVTTVKKTSPKDIIVTLP